MSFWDNWCPCFSVSIFLKNRYTLAISEIQLKYLSTPEYWITVYCKGFTYKYTCIHYWFHQLRGRKLHPLGNTDVTDKLYTTRLYLVSVKRSSDIFSWQKTLPSLSTIHNSRTKHLDLPTHDENPISRGGCIFYFPFQHAYIIFQFPLHCWVYFLMGTTSPVTFYGPCSYPAVNNILWIKSVHFHHIGAVTRTMITCRRNESSGTVKSFHWRVPQRERTIPLTIRT